MFKKGFRYVFMDQAGGGEGGGGAGNAGTAIDSGAPAPGAGDDLGGSAGAAAGGGSGAGGGGAGESVAGTGASSGAAAGAEGSALAQAGKPVIPEKYQVKKEDGSLDYEASAQKLAEAHGHLEKRLGSGDVPPKTADEYQVAVPDMLKEHWQPESDAMLQDFKKEAHAAGMTQKQFDFVMGKYFGIAPALVAGSQQLSADDCVAQLKSEWKTDAQYQAEVGKAYQAAVGYGGNDADGIIKDYGNDPRIVRLLARVGAEMGEDRSINPGGGQNGGTSVNSLMASEAYTNPKHPDHAAVSAKVKNYFDQKAAADAKSGNVPVF